MSRHLRRIERMDSARKKRVVPEHHVWPGSLASLELHANIAAFTGALAAVGQGTKRAIDIDHAVANEREAIAVWLEGYLVKPMIANDGHYSVTYDRDALVHAIRNGAHHANTPPNAREQG